MLLQYGVTMMHKTFAICCAMSVFILTDSLFTTFGKRLEKIRKRKNYAFGIDKVRNFLHIHRIYDKGRNCPYLNMFKSQYLLHPTKCCQALASCIIYNILHRLLERKGVMKYYNRYFE